MLKVKKQKIKEFKQNRIAEKLYAFAADQGISVEELKEKIKNRLKISSKQLTFYLENKGNPPDLKELCVISSILDCTLDDLVKVS